MREQSLKAATPLEAMLPYQEMLEKALSMGTTRIRLETLCEG